MHCQFHQGHCQSREKLAVGEVRRGLVQMKGKVADAVNEKNRKPDKTAGMREERNISKDQKITGTTVNYRGVN